MPRFSVIIPLYNKEKYISDTIKSVIAQTVFDFEIIVVDDGSTDLSVKQVELISDDRIKLIKCQNSGVSTARNMGIKNSSGEIICFLDADDYWYPDFLEEVQRLFAKYKDVSIVSPAYEIAYEKRTVHPNWKSVDSGQDSEVLNFYEMATAPYWTICSSCIAIKHSIFTQISPWFRDGEYVYEDYEFWLRLGGSFKFAHSNKVCATYRRFKVDKKINRTRVSYSQSFVDTISDLMRKSSEKEKQWLKQIYDRRMVPYILSLFAVRKRKDIFKVLRDWFPCKQYKKYKIALTCMTIMPFFVTDKILLLRYRLF